MAEVLELCAGGRAGCRATDSGSCLCHHQSHVEWVGCSLHDLIQPSFSFLVGVALPFSIGQPAGARPVEGRMTAHAALAIADPGLPGRLPPVTAAVADQFHVRGHAQPDRPGLYVPVRAGALLGASPVDRAGGHPRSATGRPSRSIRSRPRLRLRRGRRAGRAGRTIRPGSPPTGTRTATWPGRSTPGS